MHDRMAEVGVDLEIIWSDLPCSSREVYLFMSMSMSVSGCL